MPNAPIPYNYEAQAQSLHADFGDNDVPPPGQEPESIPVKWKFQSDDEVRKMFESID
jgi:hypothetical protein